MKATISLCWGIIGKTAMTKLILQVDQSRHIVRFVKNTSKILDCQL